MTAVAMETCPVRLCPACGDTGEPLFEGLHDDLFGAPGEWTFRECGACASLWLDPQPTVGDIGLAYRNYYTHGTVTTSGDEHRPGPLRRAQVATEAAYLQWRYGYTTERGTAKARTALVALPIRAWAGRRADADFSVMFQPAHPGGRMLDVGCGDGRLLRRMRALGWETRGVDTDPSAVAAARATGLDVDLGTLEAQAYRDGSFDLVSLSHVIEHVHDTGTLLARCLHLLRNGGRIALATPNAGSSLRRHFGRSWRGLEPPRHLCIYTPESITDLLGRAGFRNVQVRTTVRGANYVAVASRQLRRDHGHVQGAPEGARDRIAAELMQEWLAMRLLFRPHIGDEIFAVAER